MKFFLKLEKEPETALQFYTINYGCNLLKYADIITSMHAKLFDQNSYSS